MLGATDFLRCATPSDFPLEEHPREMTRTLEVGDPAPDFTLPGSDGKTYTLSQFKGDKPVVIAFFPKAFTGG